MPIYQYSVPVGGYDTNGNVLAYTDTVMGQWNFGYDQLNRLVTAHNGDAFLAGTPEPPARNWAPDFCWAYDSFGNRLQQANSDLPFTASDGNCAFNGTNVKNSWATYNAQNQMVMTDAPGYLNTPTPDDAGEIIYDGDHVYLYDAEGRVCAVNGGGGAFAYLYDAAGNRVAKGSINVWTCDITQNNFQQIGTTEGYVVGPSGEQLTEVAMQNDGTIAWKHTNVYAGGKLIGTYDNAGLHFHFDDPLGTRRAEANASGVLEAEYQSLPFGDGLSQTGNVTDPTENHFTGKERDTESGNDYMFARYYNSATGRFLSPDWSAKVEPVPYAKLGDPQSLNLYSYVENNPLNRTDPTGHCGENAQAKPCKVRDVKVSAKVQQPRVQVGDHDLPNGRQATGVQGKITDTIKSERESTSSDDGT